MQERERQRQRQPETETEQRRDPRIRGSAILEAAALRQIARAPARLSSTLDPAFANQQPRPKPPQFYTVFCGFPKR
jgi:hypothetical protein